MRNRILVATLLLLTIVFLFSSSISSASPDFGEWEFLGQIKQWVEHNTPWTFKVLDLNEETKVEVHFKQTHRGDDGPWNALSFAEQVENEGKCYPQFNEIAITGVYDESGEAVAQYTFEDGTNEDGRTQEYTFKLTLPPGIYYIKSTWGGENGYEPGNCATYGSYVIEASVRTEVVEATPTRGVDDTPTPTSTIPVETVTPTPTGTIPATVTPSPTGTVPVTVTPSPTATSKPDQCFAWLTPNLELGDYYFEEAGDLVGRAQAIRTKNAEGHWVDEPPLWRISWADVQARRQGWPEIQVMIVSDDCQTEFEFWFYPDSGGQIRMFIVNNTNREQLSVIGVGDGDHIHVDLTTWEHFLEEALHPQNYDIKDLAIQMNLPHGDVVGAPSPTPRPADVFLQEGPIATPWPTPSSGASLRN